MKTYQGSCHCGAVTFEVDTDLAHVMRCNCSICRRKSALMHRLEPEQFRLLSGEESLTLYQFHTHRAQHYFCSHCGIYTHHRPRRDPSKVVVNVGCLEGVDPLERTDYELIEGKDFD